MKLIVLLSTYNGEKYLRQQLDSLLNQSFKPYKIFVRDDGSKDETVNILEEYSSNYPFIENYYDKNLGPAKSFWDLIVKLYCSRYTLTDENLNPINSDVSSLYNFTDFPHSLIYHTAPGCTFVFNNEARKKVLKYDVDKEYIMIHDAIIHKVVAMFGKVILDKDSHILYRQHGNNEIGMNANVFKVFVGRVNRFLTGKIKNYRSNTAKSLLKVYGDECSEENRELLNTVANYMNDRKLKKRLMNDECFKSHTGNDLFFKILV